MKAAPGNCCQIARSSAVTVSQPNLYMYRPGSVTNPICAQVILLTVNLGDAWGLVRALAASVSFAAISEREAPEAASSRTHLSY